MIGKTAIPTMTRSVGPRHLAGWFIGGVFVYWVARILTNNDEKILSLILINSPFSLNRLNHLFIYIYKYCKSLYLFGYKLSSLFLLRGKLLYN